MATIPYSTDTDRGEAAAKDHKERSPSIEERRQRTIRFLEKHVDAA